TCTVQAPQNAIPQPNLVPVKPRVSRNTHSRGVFGGTSTTALLPLTVSITAAIMAFSLVAGKTSRRMRWDAVDTRWAQGPMRRPVSLIVRDKGRDRSNTLPGQPQQTPGMAGASAATQAETLGTARRSSSGACAHTESARSFCIPFL